MNVTVKLKGPVGGARAGSFAESLDLSLPDGSTAGDLLVRLAERCGDPFRQLARASGPRLPAKVRVFVDGELALERDRPLCAPGATSPNVVVVILSPVMGGAR